MLDHAQATIDLVNAAKDAASQIDANEPAQMPSCCARLIVRRDEAGDAYKGTK